MNDNTDLKLSNGCISFPVHECPECVGDQMPDGNVKELPVIYETDILIEEKQTNSNDKKWGKDNRCEIPNIPNIVVENYCHDNNTEKDNDDDSKVTLRRKKTSFSENVETITNDDYKYMDYLQVPKTGTSRRKIEIGSEKMISNDDLRLAATLVHDAMEGRTTDIKTEPKYVRSYNRYKSWPLTYLLYIAIIVDLSLVVFEEPAVQGFAIHYSVTMFVEGVCLVYFTIRTCHNFHWRRTKSFFKDVKNIFIIGILVLTILDMLLFVILKQVIPDGRDVRYTRVLRPLLIVNFSDGRQIRRAWRNMRRTIKEIVHVLFLFYFFIFVFALIAYQMFSHRNDMKYPDGKDYFKNYMDSVWDLYVLVTTSNNPDVMMPAVEKSRFYCAFFFVYILVCFYLLLNVFLAVAYHSYNENMKVEIKTSARDKKKKLVQAFDVIKINHKGEDMVTYRIWKRLMTLAQPKLSKNQIDLLMLILDMNRSGHIGRREFMNVADLLNVPVSEVADRTTYLEKWFPKIYNSTPAEYLKTFVDSVFFKFMYDIVVIIEVFLIGFDVAHIDVPFCCLFFLEILIKVFTYGPLRYFKRFSNWFDVFITSASCIFIITSYVYPYQGVVFTETSKIIQIIRIFRILRLLVHIKRFKIITDTLVNISLSIVMYCGILFIIFYIFAIIGIEVFQGKINDHTHNVTNETLEEMYCGALELKGSAFYESRYCSLNFNDFISSVLVLSTILFENNWHILTQGYVLVAGKAARIYFAVFFMCVSVVVMNIVTAFVVDMFMYEYTIQKEGKVDSTVEKKIKDLGLGIDAETGLEISAPLSDNEMEELLKDGTIQKPKQHPWVEKATMHGLRSAEVRFSAISSFVTKRKSSVPTLNRFDGIRFHIKKRGWTKIEILLQQLYDVECDIVEECGIDVTVNHTDQTQNNRLKSMIL
ncbi:uncharacterized protein LOC123543029 [Mercenaria mercenaria]|uniref:uncharacterized protein LOC123543029 n=1 Tax=Mercenaria mercenaria TaxID=6596 RepID=UPI00234F85C4|nr:uncharacterized protein LOC123543029 [Mercenaria mercenaria]